MILTDLRMPDLCRETERRWSERAARVVFITAISGPSAVATTPEKAGAP